MAPVALDRLLSAMTQRIRGHVGRSPVTRFS